MPLLFPKAHYVITVSLTESHPSPDIHHVPRPCGRLLLAVGLVVLDTFDWLAALAVLHDAEALLLHRRGCGLVCAGDVRGLLLARTVDNVVVSPNGVVGVAGSVTRHFRVSVVWFGVCMVGGSGVGG